MMVFSMGLPGRFAEWCDAITSRLVEQAVGPVESAFANTIEEFALAIMRTRSPCVVLSSRQPLGRLRTAIMQANRPFIVALDDPRLALEDLVVRHRMDFIEATRAVANSCASMASCDSIPGAFVLRPEEEGAHPVATAEAIAHHFELGVSKAAIENIVAALSDVGLTPRRTEGISWWDSLVETERALVTGALDPYAARFSGGELGSITWERELFFIYEEPPPERPQSAGRPVDITGRPRFVIFGPYMILPPGSWSATIALGFSKEAAEISYIVEIIAGMQLTNVRIHPRSERFMEVNLHFTLDESIDHPIEVRVASERAAFDGRLALGHVIMTPQGHMRTQTREYFNTALSE